MNLDIPYCRTKLNVTKEQLADQKAYVQQLKATEADKTVIERERTVEKQLRKKEVQMTILSLDFMTIFLCLSLLLALC